jgi:hypothetical protein
MVRMAIFPPNSRAKERRDVWLCKCNSLIVLSMCPSELGSVMSLDRKIGTICRHTRIVCFGKHDISPVVEFSRQLHEAPAS